MVLRLVVATFLVAAINVHPMPSAATGVASSRVYVVAYPCAPAEGGPVVAPGDPVVSVHDQAFYGDPGDWVETTPRVTMTSATSDTVEFYFDLPPGNYSAWIRFPTKNPKEFCSRNGPLVVLPGKDRHLFVATMDGVTDWHSVAAVAGRLPMSGVRVSVLVYDHPMHCGDDVRSYDPKTFRATVSPHDGSAVIDDGAYYQNIHAYGKVDHTVAIAVSGGLFTQGTVLLTVTPDTKANKPPFLRKDITPAILHAATANPFDQKLVCIAGF